MGKSALFEFYKVGTLLKMHDMCPDSKSSCQKQVNFTPEVKQFQLEGNRCKKNYEENYRKW